MTEPLKPLNEWTPKELAESLARLEAAGLIRIERGPGEEIRIGMPPGMTREQMGEMREIAKSVLEDMGHTVDDNGHAL